MSTDNFDISEEFMRLKEDAPLSNHRVEPIEDATDSDLYSDNTKKKKKKKNSTIRKLLRKRKRRTMKQSSVLKWLNIVRS